MLEERVADKSLIRIIRKWLKAGVMEELKHWSPSTEGTPQGGVISPLLGNIYLHFVQDLWIKKVVTGKSKGSVLFRRYADDSIVCFERKDDAEAYLRALPGRLAKFGLEVAEEKSALVKFNRWEPESSGRFTFIPPTSRSAGQASRQVAALSRSMQSRLRLLLGEEAAQSQVLASETHHDREEVPGRTGLAQGLDQEVEERSAFRTDGHPRAQAAGLLELLRRHRQLRAPVELRLACQAVCLQMAQPPKSAPEFHVGAVRRSVGAVGDPLTPGGREAMAACSTKPVPPRMRSSTNNLPIMVEVPPARIPEEPGAVVPHAGICEGGVGQPTSLPQSPINPAIRHQKSILNIRSTRVSFPHAH